MQHLHAGAPCRRIKVEGPPRWEGLTREVDDPNLISLIERIYGAEALEKLGLRQTESEPRMFSSPSSPLLPTRLRTMSRCRQNEAMVTTVGLHDRWAPSDSHLVERLRRPRAHRRPLRRRPRGETYTLSKRTRPRLWGQLARQGLTATRTSSQSALARPPRLRTDRSVQAGQVLNPVHPRNCLRVVILPVAIHGTSSSSGMQVILEQREVGRLLQLLGIRVVAIEGHLVHDAVIRSFGSSRSASSSLILTQQCG